MRPYFVLMAAVLLAVAAFAQQTIPHPGYSSCFYGCGPFVPLVTTPEISLEQFSPNPVGASNATTGLIAGATNSTLSQIQGSTSSVYTVPVWYQGGAPLITPEVRLYPEKVIRCTTRSAKNVGTKSARLKSVCTRNVRMKNMAHEKKRAPAGPILRDRSTPPARRSERMNRRASEKRATSIPTMTSHARMTRTAL